MVVYLFEPNMNGGLTIGSVPIWQFVLITLRGSILSHMSKDDNMTILARRFSIISLILMIFAFVLAGAVHKNKAANNPYLTGDLFICTTGNELICGVQNTSNQ